MDGSAALSKDPTSDWAKVSAELFRHGKEAELQDWLAAKGAEQAEPLVASGRAGPPTTSSSATGGGGLPYVELANRRPR
jgi:hypothetical protein